MKQMLMNACLRVEDGQIVDARTELFKPPFFLGCDTVFFTKREQHKSDAKATVCFRMIIKLQ